MRDRLATAAIFLATGAMLVVVSPLRTSLTSDGLLAGALFLVVAVAVLVRLDLRPAAFLVVWGGAVVTLAAMLAPLDSSMGVELAAAIFFATLAMSLWFMLSLGLRLFWLEGRGVSRR